MQYHHLEVESQALDTSGSQRRKVCFHLCCLLRQELFIQSNLFKIEIVNFQFMQAIHQCLPLSEIPCWPSSAGIYMCYQASSFTNIDKISEYQAKKKRDYGKLSTYLIVLFSVCQEKGKQQHNPAGNTRITVKQLQTEGLRSL